MKNEIEVFEKQNLDVFKKLSEFKKQIEVLKKQEDELKGYLLKEMETHGVKSFKNDYITISHVDESTSTTVDLKALKEKEPECYEGLIKDYPKVTTRKASVRFTVK